MNKLESIRAKVLETIKEKSIHPKARWTFLLKDYFVIGVSILSLLVGSIAFSVIIFLVKNDDWAVYDKINNSLLGFTLLSLPYFWIICLILFIVVAEYNFNHTKHGYKHKPRLLVLASVFLSIILGIFLYNLGIGQAIDGVFYNRIPFYEKMIEEKRRRWDAAEEGFLWGRIFSLQEDQFLLKNIKEESWVIKYDKSILTRRPLQEGMIIKVFGEKIGDAEFEAIKILPAGVLRKSFKRGVKGAFERNNFKTRINK